MTAGGGNIIGGEVSRNKRAPQCGVASIEAAEGSHPAPHAFGKALTGDLKGLWRYRAGDYRIIAAAERYGPVSLSRCFIGYKNK